jgi:hypothetical protein
MIEVGPVGWLGKTGRNGMRGGTTPKAGNVATVARALMRWACIPPLLLSVWIASSSAVRADTVQELFQDCKDTANFKRIACVKYIGGIVDVMHSWGEVFSDRLIFSNPSDTQAEREASAHARRFILNSFSICGNITYGAAMQAFINWAERNPAEWQDHPALHIVDALRETWPCRGD